MLRFEPLPHKNTLGFWVNKDDYATFEFTVDEAGHVHGGGAAGLRQGQRRQRGGTWRSATQKLTFTVKDTGGFQNFEARESAR